MAHMTAGDLSTAEDYNVFDPKADGTTIITNDWVAKVTLQHQAGFIRFADVDVEETNLTRKIQDFYPDEL